MRKGLVVSAAVVAVLAFSSSILAQNITRASRRSRPTKTYTIGGTVSGLVGTGLVLQDNGGNNLAVSANGSFTFRTALPHDTDYSVTVLTQPTSPTQICVVTSGSGTVTGSNVTNVAVACTTNTSYTIGGTVSGLSGSGLVLQDNGGNNLVVPANGSFTFTTALANGSAYNVTVLTQPTSPSQACVVTSGSGTVAGSNVANVAVACTTNTFTIGGTVSGLSGSGLVLQDNGGNNLAVSANGSFTFTTALANGSAYSVTVLTQPTSPSQACVVTSGSGTVAGSNVANVAVACTTNTYTIGGTVSGLSGSGLVLQDNGGNNLAVSANGSFTFTTALANGSAYSVTVLTQPTSPSQACVVTSGSGTVASSNVANVAVACTTSTYTIGGTVSGLSGSGLVLQDNGGNNLAVPANGSFTFTTALANGSAYSVTVLTQPTGPSQACVVTSGSGTVAGSNVANVAVACTTSTYTIGGTVSGLSGSGLVLQDNGGNNLAVSANGLFTFTTALANGSAYSVTVLSQPTGPSQTCVVTSGSGTVTISNVTNVSVVCTMTSTYMIGGTISGLTGSGLALQDNGGDNLALSANGPFTFATGIASGAAYSVTVLTQPTSPSQSCSVTSGSGTVTNAPINTVAVTCSSSAPVLVNWTDVHQEIDGFGGSDTSSSGSMTLANQDFFFGTGTGQLGLSLLRVAATNDSGARGNCTTVSTSCAGEYVNDMKAVIAQGGKVYASPWTPPAAYKTNGLATCTNGAGLITTDYAAYATWLANFVQSLQTEYGITLDALSVQNEPDQCQNYDSAVWSAEDIDTFVSANLGPTFAADGLSTLIFVPEGGSYNAMYLGGTCGADPSCNQYVGGINWHDYDASLSGSNTIAADPYPSGWPTGKKYWETEASCGPGFGPNFCESGFNTDITDALDWAAVIDQRIAVDGANAWLYWWLIGDNTDDQGLITSDGTIAQRAYMMGQYSKFVRPGYYRIDATHLPEPEVSVSAYQSTATNTLVIIATNYSASSVSQTFTITNAPTFSAMTPWTTSATLSLDQQPSVSVSSNSFTYTLPPDSITTFVGTP